MEADNDTTIHYNVGTDVWHTSKDCAGTNDALVFTGDYLTWSDGRACKRCAANDLRKSRGD